MDNPIRAVSTKTVYQNPWIKVREDSIVRTDGTEGIYGVMESKDSVMVVVLNDKHEVYLIHAFSYPVMSWSWELPGGGGEGELAETASKRELAEETGIIAEHWTHLGKTRVCNGLMTERMSVYLAQDLSFGDKVESEDADVINKGRFFSLDEIDTMIEEGDIDDGQTITGLYQLHRWLKKQQ
ncbi:MAG: NUDIX hydrolase [Candidatus Microsaccharimonas sp.]